MQKLSGPCSKRQKSNVNDDAIIQGSEFDENQCCVFPYVWRRPAGGNRAFVGSMCVDDGSMKIVCYNYEDVLTDNNGRKLIYPYCVICDQICQKGSYTCTVSRHTFYRHLLATSMDQQHICLILLKVEQSAFTQASFSSLSGIHECSGSL